MKKFSRPNIVYILADDLGYGDVGCYETGARIPTGHIDELAGKGLRFTDCHTSSAVCTPTRYSILTGCYNWRSPLKSGVLTGESPLIIDENAPTCASVLRDAGYHTACIGKWHLGLGWETKDGTDLHDPLNDWSLERLKHLDFGKPVSNGPNSLGFDESFILPASLDIPPYVYLEDHCCVGTPSEESELGVDTPYLMRRGIAVPGLKAETVMPTFTERCVGAIDRLAGKEKPFFIYFPLTAPHTPIVPTEEFRGSTDIGLYGDFVREIDDIVGQVVEALRRNGILEETLIIFTSDNGASPAVHLDELRKLGHSPNGWWRGHKADLYEGGHRVPFIVHWPAAVQPGVCDQTICTTDFLATAATLAGASIPEGGARDSADLTPLLLGEQPPGEPVRSSTIHHSVDGKFAIRSGPWKLLDAPGSGGWSFPRTDSPEAEKLPPRQLYNLEKDPGETMNLIDVYPEEASRLLAELDRIREDE